MATLSTVQTINKMKIGSADKVLLTSIFTGLQGDIEKLRAAYAALLAKLDTNHGAASDHVATLNVAASTLTVGK